MDRSTKIGYILMIALFAGFFFFSKDNTEQIELQKQQHIQDSIQRVNDLQSVQLKDSVKVTEPIAPDTAKPLFAEAEFNLSNNLIDATFTNKGGVPKAVELLEYKRFDSSKLILFEEDQTKFDYKIPMANSTVVSSSELEFKASEQSDTSLVLEAAVPGGGKIIQQYTLVDDSYGINYNLQFVGLEGVIAPNNPYVVLNWTSQMQQQEKSIDDERNKSTIYFKYQGDSDIDYLSETGDDDDELQSNIHWVSFKQKFFNQTLIHKDGFSESGSKIEIKMDEESDYVEDASAKFYFPIANTIERHKMRLYYGPNHYNTLKKEDISLHKIIPLGWGIFGWVNKGLVIPIFNFLDNYFVSYGLIIFLLTLFIKLLLMFPLFKVYKSSAKMKVLKPELDAIKEKTGGDAAKAQQEQMKLYKQAGVSPLGGCLPQLVQIPILFAMFNFFPASIELRQKALWWCKDLSTYDSIWTFGEVPILNSLYGDHVSLFTLLMTIVTLVYTFMNSQATGQMAGPMKIVMYVMPIMFLGFFNNYAAALSFYYFLSTSITIIQNFVIRKFFIDEDKLRAEIEKNKKKKVGNRKKSGMQKRLEKMAKKRGVDLNNPGGKKPQKNNKR